MQILKAVCCFLAASAVLSRAATLEADYQFQNTLASSFGGIPDLNYIAGPPAYAADTVDGQSRQILSVLSGGGPQAIFNNFISSNNYSFVLLASLNASAAIATKLADFKNFTTDSGLYINNGILSFYDTNGIGFITDLGGTPLLTNGYGQIVLTRDGTTSQTTAYVNGAMAFSFVDNNGLAIVNGTNSESLLSFFKDDGIGLMTENTSGNIARLRLYEGALTAGEVAGLDRLTPVPEPSGLATLILGAVLGAGLLRRK